MNSSKLYKKYSTIIDSGKIEEREIISLKSALRRESLSKEEKQNLESRIANNNLLISTGQTKKGYDFLVNLWKTPTGKERKNNPYGYREEDVLENFESFTFDGFYDDSNYYQQEMGIRDLYPLYTVIGKEMCFQYYYNHKGLQIIG